MTAVIAQMARPLPVREVSRTDRVTVRDWSGLPVRIRDRAHAMLPPLRIGRGRWYRVGEYRGRADGAFMTVVAQRVAGGAVIYGTEGDG